MQSPADQTRPTETPLEDMEVPSRRVRTEIAALSDRGLARSTNEDAYVVFRMGRFLERITSNVPESVLPSRIEDTGHVMIVADGMGGHEAGEVASQSALVSTLRFILGMRRWALNFDDPATREAEIQKVLDSGRTYVASVHAAVRQQASGDARLVGMGTTLTAVYSVGLELFVSHIGDSKAYLVREGKLSKITRDHTLAQEYADLGLIPQQEVAGHQLHHVLTRAVGGPDEELEGDFHHLLMTHGDRLLLCSDGLTDMASEEEIAAVLAAHPRSEDACRALVDLALRGGGRDNVTVIVTGYQVE